MMGKWCVLAGGGEGTYEASVVHFFLHLCHEPVDVSAGFDEAE